MEYLMWAGIAVLTVVVGWFLLSLAASYLMPPEKSGRAYLKKVLKERGIDVGRIPDAALDEIVSHSINAAKASAMFAGADVSRKNWRSNLVNFLNAEAEMVGVAMEGHRHQFDMPTEQTLRKFGVIS